MDNVEKWPNILKKYAEFAPQGFKIMFGHFQYYAWNS